jgi:hypothetical protein
VVAVLLYRVISFWLILPIGWAAWAWLAWIARRRPWPVPASAADPDRLDSRAEPGAPAGRAEPGTPASHRGGDGDGDVSEAAL